MRLSNHRRKSNEEKFDKIGKDAVIEELEKIEVEKEAVEKIIEFISINGTSDEKIEKLKKLNIENETYIKGVEDDFPCILTKANNKQMEVRINNLFMLSNLSVH